MSAVKEGQGVGERWASLVMDARRIREVRVLRYAGLRARRLMERVGAVGVVIASAAAAFADGTKQTTPLPPEARAVIEEVSGAAGKNDLKALRAAMAKDFTWSFGGDSDADQAIAEWAKDPRYLRELPGVLRDGCEATAPDRIECPGSGDLGFRAGFKKIDGKWSMDYFVEGD